MTASSPPSSIPSAKTPRWLDRTLVFLLSVFALLAARYQYFLFKHIEWGDESETIVTAKMMAAGQSLYSEIFNHHGPLTFLTGVLLESFGDFGVVAHRVPIVLLQLAGLISIYRSPIFLGKSVALACAGFALAIILFFLPEFLGHTYTYQAITGAFLLIIFFLYTFPALLKPEALTFWRIFTGAALIAGLPFLAAPYAPLAAILLVVSMKKGQIKPALMGASVAVVGNLVFLAVYGSIPGFLAFHLYLNSQILPLYLGSLTPGQLVLTALGSATRDIGQFIYFSLSAVGIFILSMREQRLPWRSILLAVGVGSLLIRGVDFRGLPYYYTLISFILLLAISVEKINTQAKLIGAFFIILCIAKASLLLPGERKYFSQRKIPVETEFSKLVKQHTEKSDRIIAYSFRNYEYIAADRLPASGHFFYFPWQEKYNDEPQYGIKIDACKEIDIYRPKVMLIDKWLVWGLYPWDAYAGCVQDLIDKYYTQVPGRPYYLRNDLPAARSLVQ